MAEYIGLSDIALHFSNLAAFPTALSEYLDTTGLIKLKSKKKREAWKKLVSFLASIDSERSVAAHGVWGPGRGFTLATMAAQVRNAKLPPTEAILRSKRGKTRTIKAEKLLALAKALSNAQFQLWQFAKTNWVRPAIKRQQKAHFKRVEQAREEMRFLAKITKAVP